MFHELLLILQLGFPILFVFSKRHSSVLSCQSTCLPEIFTTIYAMLRAILHQANPNFSQLPIELRDLRSFFDIPFLFDLSEVGLGEVPFSQ